ncbi:MAG: hypothetical protein A2X94_01325 [Bdellovibrionales bacterium GWB1_55_8]|nr:MAG: hypothetical protein A2X94_01325 [Bdellovibrionales bacterium GWB1_55_8]
MIGPMDPTSTPPENSTQITNNRLDQPAVSPSPPGGRAGVTRKKKRLSPLALVLLLSASFFVIFMIVSGALFLYRSPGKGVGTSALFSSGSVGVIEIEGVILDSKKALEEIEELESDSDVKAIVIRLNSPGGAVAPSQEIYEAVKKLNKPVVASMGSVAASGAYYIACGAKKVFANPGTITGSIGVIMEFANLERLYEWAKVRRFTIKTGKFKDLGSEYREMDAEDRQLLQDMINDVLDQFKAAVSSGRKISLDQVTKLADGRIFSGSQAKAAKLVDQLGTLDDAIAEAGALGGIKGKPRVSYAERKRPRLLQLLLDDSMGEGESSQSRKGLIQTLIMELTGNPAHPAVLSPGVYWLWSGSR